MPPRGVQKGSKRARQYEHIKSGAKKRGASEGRAEEIAARTVNKERRPVRRIADSVEILDPGRVTVGAGRTAIGHEPAQGQDPRPTLRGREAAEHFRPLSYEQGTATTCRRPQAALGTAHAAAPSALHLRDAAEAFRAAVRGPTGASNHVIMLTAGALFGTISAWVEFRTIRRSPLSSPCWLGRGWRRIGPGTRGRPTRRIWLGSPSGACKPVVRRWRSTTPTSSSTAPLARRRVRVTRPFVAGWLPSRRSSSTPPPPNAPPRTRSRMSNAPTDREQLDCRTRRA